MIGRKRENGAVVLLVAGVEEYIRRLCGLRLSLPVHGHPGLACTRCRRARRTYRPGIECFKFHDGALNT